MNPLVVCIHRCHLQQEDARPDDRCDDTIRYDTIEEINVDSKAEYTA